MRHSYAYRLWNSIPLLAAFHQVVLSQECFWQVVRSGGDTLPQCILYRLKDSMVTLSSLGVPLTLHIDSIDVLTRHRESRFGTGAAYGAVLGAAFGALVVMGSGDAQGSGPWGTIPIGLVTGPSTISGALIGGGLGFVIGGIFGSAVGRVETYQLSGKPREKKVALLRRAIGEGA